MKKENKAKRERVLRFDEAKLGRRLLDLLLLTLAVTLLVEGFNQGGADKMLRYLARRPIYFGYNCLVVFATLALSELFRSRRAVSWTISLFWAILGFANYMVCRNRTQPLVSGDLIITREILGMTTLYFSWAQIILAFVLILLLIFGLVTVYARIPKRRQVNYVRAFGGVLTGVCCAFFICILSIKAGLIPVHFGDRVDAYHDYGFATCFSFTFGKQGVDEPDTYSNESVTQILDEIEAPETTAEPVSRFNAEDNLEHPNIVFVQLESVFDVNDVRGIELSRDPMPNYHRLMQENPNGILYVPTIGGGTANVEFEVMTGMNMDFFGAGEAPYSTILREVTCESIAHDLRKNGYHTTTLHNNTGFFFSRNEVYANLGYDCFDSLEYMAGPKYNEVGWAHDRVLIDEMMTAMKNSEERDLLFAITVESHGKYADTYQYEAGDVEILSLPEGAYLANFQNYINLIPDVDDFIGKLIAEFEAYDEPILAIFYGDHLPALGLEAEMLVTGDLYASRYVIWNNYDADFQAPDLQSYRLSAELFRQLGISDGLLTKFHQNYSLSDESPEYMEKLQTLQYDLLYGERNAYGEDGPYAPTNIVYGVNPVRVDSVVSEYDRLLVKGDGFTQFSKLVCDENVLDTLYVDRQTLVAALPDDDAKPLRVCIAQINADGKEMSRTGEIAVTE